MPFTTIDNTRKNTRMKECRKQASYIAAKCEGLVELKIKRRMPEYLGHILRSRNYEHNSIYYPRKNRMKT